MITFLFFLTLTASLPQLREDAMPRALFVPHGKESKIYRVCCVKDMPDLSMAMPRGLRF
jgi:hypothetical protein